MSRLSAASDCESACQSSPRTRSSSGLPIELLAIEPEEFAGGIVQISDPAVGVGDDDPFLDGIKNRLQETFFLGEAKEIILHVLRPDPAEAFDQFFEETGFHVLRYRARSSSDVVDNSRRASERASALPCAMK